MRTTWRFSLVVIGVALTLFGRPYLARSAERADIHKTPPVVAGERFADNGDGTVADTRRQLMWQQDDNEKEVTFTEAQRYCRDLRLGDHGDWRLPKPVEGETAVVFQLMMPKHSRDAYAHFDLYWSADPTMLLPFNYRPAQGREVARIYPASGEKAFVRCVRSLETRG
jgi:hypothetical protein